MSKKLFCYVDESGQDTHGQLFIVGVVVVESQREELCAICETVERQSGKNRLKWYEASHRTRMAYMRDILALLPGNVQLCFAYYRDAPELFMLTVDAIANAVLWSINSKPEQTNDYKVTALVDGLPKNQERLVGSLLRRRGIRIDKIRGVKQDENDGLIRLADALCGFVRQAINNVPEARLLFDEYLKKGSLQDVAANRPEK